MIFEDRSWGRYTGTHPRATPPMLSGLPPIVVGTAHLGQVIGLRSNRPALQHLDRLLEVGCTAFDLAAAYQLGGTERLFGQWFSSRRVRDQVFVISKGGHPIPVVRPHRLGQAALTADLHASLRRLRTDRIDLYLLHRDDAHTPLDEIAGTLTRFVAEEKIAAWGVSNWTHRRVHALDEAVQSRGGPPIGASSPQLSLIAWSQPPWPGCVSITGDAEAYTFYGASQIPVFAWSPIGGGFFATDVQARAHSERIYGTSANRARRERAETLARRHGCTPAQVALAYLLHQPFPVIPVVASTRIERMEQNLQAAEIPIDAAELHWLEQGGPSTIENTS